MTAAHRSCTVADCHNRPHSIVVPVLIDRLLDVLVFEIRWQQLVVSYSGRLALDDVSLSIDEMRVKKVISWLMLFTSRFTAPDITWVLDKLIFVSYSFIVEVFLWRILHWIYHCSTFVWTYILSLFSIRFSFSYLIFINIGIVGCLFDIESVTTNTERNRFYLFLYENQMIYSELLLHALRALYLLSNYTKVMTFGSKLANRKLKIWPIEDCGFKTISLLQYLL